MTLNATPSFSFTIKTTSQTSFSFSSFGDEVVGEANNTVDVLLSSTATITSGNDAGERTGDYFINNYSTNGTENYSIDLSTLLSSTSDKLPGPSNNVNILALANGDTVVEYNNDDSSQTSFSFNAYYIVLNSSGAMVTGPTQINTLTGISQTRVVTMAELSNGDIAFSYQRSDNGSIGTRVFTAGGTAVDAETVVSNYLNSYESDVAASSSGGYMVVYALGNNSGTSDYSIYNNAGVLQSSGTAFTDSATGADPVVVALSNGDYLVEDGDNAFNGNSIAGKIYTSAGSLVGSVTLPAYSFGQVIALNGASDPSFVAPVTDPAYDAALATYANFTDVSDNLFVNSYTSAGTQSAGPTQIDTGTAKGVLNSTSSYYSTDTAPTYSLSSGLNGGLIEVDSAPDQNTGTTSTITVRLFDWPGGGPVAPSVSAITPTGSSPTKSASDSFTVTFSAAVQNVLTSNFSLTGTDGTGTIGTPTSSDGGTTWTVPVTGVSGNGTLGLSLSSVGTIVAVSGGAALSGTYSSGGAYTIDTTSPSVSSIDRVGASPNNASSDAFTVTFSESVTGVVSSDFTAVTTNTAHDTGITVSGSGSTYTLTVDSVTGDGTLGLNLTSPGTIQDLAGNDLSTASFTGQLYTIEHTPPSVTSIDLVGTSPNNASSDAFTVTFSESVTGVVASDFTAVTTNTAHDTGITVSGSGSTYTLTVDSVTGDGTLGLNLTSPGTIQDLAGNDLSNVSFTGQVYTIEHTPPSVSSIDLVGASSNNASTEQFTVTFSEAVFGVATGAFSLADTGTVSGTIASISGSGTTYTVTVTGVTGDGTLGLDLKSSGTGITDAAGNAISGGFTSGQVYTIEHTPPSVSSIDLGGTSPNNASSDAFTVTFSESVTGVVASDFTAVTTNTVHDTGITVSGSGSTYTLTVDGVTGDGTLGLNLTSPGTIQDLAGNDLSTASFTGQLYTIEHTPPSVSSINVVGASPNNASSDQFTVTFSESVTGVVASDFTAVTTGDVADSSVTVNGSGSVYTVTVSGVTGDGTLGLDLNSSGTGIEDAAGNPISGGFTSGQVYTIDHGPEITAGTVTGTEGASTGSVTVATFTDAAFTSPTTADFTATINWGDGTAASTGTIVAENGGVFAVEGAHTYAEEGSYTIGVAVTDTNSDTGNADSSATVADAPLTAGTATLTGGVEDVTATTLLATFTDANPIAPTTDFSGTINWGDGTSTPFTSAAVTQPGGVGTAFDVAGSHIYAEEGSYTASVTINDDGGSTATDSGTATVADAPLTAGTATLTGGVEDVTATTLLATFTDANPIAPTTDFSGTINWGDGTSTPFTSAAVTQPGGVGTAFDVAGSHIYAEEGSYTASVTINDDGGSTATDTGSATVADAPLTAGIVTVNGGVESITPATLSATFTDANALAPTSDFTATISWGDGTTTTGTVTQSGGVGTAFDVVGSHTYGDEGSYTTSVSINDVDGSSATDTGTATVAEGDVFTPQGVTMTPDAGQASVTATFSDVDTGTPADDFSATINWGDGVTTAGTVSGGNGSFTVNGLHTYAAPAAETVTVTLIDDLPGTATGTITLAVPATPVVTATAVNATPSESFAASALFSASDAEAFPTLAYEVEDTSTGASQGFWVLNGAVLPNGQITTLTAAQLAQLSFVAGASSSTSVIDTLQVAASDSAGFGPFTTFTVTASKLAPGDVAPTVTAASVQKAPSLNLAASILFNASVPQSETIASYEVEDTTTDSGYWVFDGVVEPTNQLIDVTTAQLSELSFVTGYGSDTLMVRANDGTQWSSFTTFTVTPPPNAAPPAGTADTLVMERQADGAYELYNIGHNGIQLDGPLGAINPALQVAGVGGFDGSDTTDLLMRDPTTGAFTLYDVSNNNITGNVALAQVGPNWQVAGFGDFSGHAGETDMLMQNSMTGAFEVYDISNNAITFAAGMGQVGAPWQVAGFGDFSGRANETDMLMRNSTTGAFEVYDISNNAITSAAGMGQVGAPWQVAGFGDFSGRANETDMLMRNSTTGAFEVYDISNNAITSAASMGQVGLEWQVAGFGDFSDRANETDMLMRDSATGAFELYDISNNAITTAASIGQVGTEWSVAGIGAGGASAPPGAQLSGIAVDPASAALTQAMASFSASAASNSLPVPVSGTAEQLQQTILTTPQG